MIGNDAQPPPGIATGRLSRRALWGGAVASLAGPGPAHAAEGPGDQIVREAMRHKGKRYAMRGIGPNEFNCSGFSWFVVDQALDVDISYYLRAQFKQGRKVSRQGIRAGDLVFFKNTQGKQKGPTHVGIALGRTTMIHAANLKEDVTISRIASYRKYYLGARRLDPNDYS